jgi:hypothetical protein
MQSCDSSNGVGPPVSVAISKGATKQKDVQNAALVLIDYQDVQLNSIPQDPGTYSPNAVALAKAGRLLGLPTGPPAQECRTTRGSCWRDASDVTRVLSAQRPPQLGPEGNPELG